MQTYNNNLTLDSNGVTENNGGLLVDIRNVTFAYKSRHKADKQVFSGLNFRLNRGQICGLLGLNGSGKSTLLHLVSGLLFPQAGQVFTCGHDMSGRPVETLRSLFLVPEEFELPRMSIRKYLEVYAPFWPKFSLERMKAALEEFRIDFETPSVAGQSMGQKKKVMLSFALATGADLLLMDEPTNGLDIPAKTAFRKAVARTLTESQTLLVSTHQVRDIDSMLDHVLILDNSKVLLDASMEELQKKLTVRVLSAGTTIPAGVITTMPAAGGTLALCQREDGDGESGEVNLEMLFNAVMENPGFFGNLFNK